jgi:hypothetical protein
VKTIRCKHAGDREPLDACCRWSGKHDTGVAEFAPRRSGTRPRPHKHGPCAVGHEPVLDDDTDSAEDPLTKAADNVKAALLPQAPVVATVQAPELAEVEAPVEARVEVPVEATVEAPVEAAV